MLSPIQAMTLGEALRDGLFIDGDWIETKDQDPGGEVRLIQLADIGDGAFRDRSARFLTITRAKELNCTFLETGDVLVARMPEPLGRACIFPGIGGPAVTAVDVCILRPNRNRVRPEWLVKAINAPDFRESMQAFVRGTTRQRISRGNLGGLRLLVPPVSEQIATAEFVDSLDPRRVDATRHIEGAAMAVERFRRSVLAAACSGRLTADWRDTNEIDTPTVTLQLKRLSDRARLGGGYREPSIAVELLPEISESWTWAMLPELGQLGRGKSKHRPRNDEALYGGKYPFIQTGDVARANGRIIKHTQTYNEAGLAQSKLWPSNTICITIAANIADTAILTFPACFPDSVVGLIADESIAQPEYVELFLRTARSDLAAFAPATAQANINLAILSQLAVALPPIEEQRVIIRRVDQIYARCASIEAAIQSAAAKLAITSTSVLASAFRGELPEVGVVR